MDRHTAIQWLVHSTLAVDWVGCYIWYSEEGTGRGRSPPKPLIAVPNVTAHPSTASVPITVLLYRIMVRCSAVVMCPLKGQVRLSASVMHYWEAETLCYQLLLVCPFVRPLPKFLSRYFEKRMKYFGANWNKLSASNGMKRSILGVRRSK